MRHQARIERVQAAAYRIPTDQPEADGTYAWSATTLVVVHVLGAGMKGFGYTYASAAAAHLIREQLAPRIVGLDALAIEQAWNTLVAEVRNIGRPGIASMAISAIDAALWDLKAKLLDLPLVRLLGDAREAVPAYGSGGFTNYSIETLTQQLRAWVEAGIGRIKMKVGSKPSEDVARVAAAREAIGEKVELMVDANGAYRPSESIAKAQAFARYGVTWLEEPVSSDDLDGLREIRGRAPPGMQVAAGEYGFDSFYFRRMLEARAVDVLQADATRCLGVTGFLAAARLCQAFGVPLSTHTAPSLHLHLACSTPATVHVEYFHDHARIERMLFDGFQQPNDGSLWPDRARPGLGIEFKQADASQFAL